MGIVEHVARALCADAGSDPDKMVQHPAQKYWEPPSIRSWERHEHDAKVALKAASEWMAKEAKHEWEED